MNKISNPFERLLPYSGVLPKEIHKRITRSNGESIFMGRRFKDGTLIPILNEAYDEYNERTGFKALPFFDRYSEGVIQGKKYPFIPHIDTPENRKELIMNYIIQEIYLVPEVTIDDPKEEGLLLSKYMYWYGVEVGKLYKAWCIVLQNPKYFVDDFKKLDALQASTKDNLSIYHKLEDLFIDKSLVEASINILREIEPPAIDWHNNYIGHLKGIVVIWLDELLLAKPPIIKSVPNEVRATLLNKKFPGLNISKSTMYSNSNRANEYKLDIKTLVSKLIHNTRNTGNSGNSGKVS